MEAARSTPVQRITNRSRYRAGMVEILWKSEAMDAGGLLTGVRPTLPEGVRPKSGWRLGECGVSSRLCLQRQYLPEPDGGGPLERPGPPGT